MCRLQAVSAYMQGCYGDMLVVLTVAYMLGLGCRLVPVQEEQWVKEVRETMQLFTEVRVKIHKVLPGCLTFTLLMVMLIVTLFLCLPLAHHTIGMAFQHLFIEFMHP